MIRRAMAKETVLESIIAFLFGHKYYANIIYTRGTTRQELSSFIHRSREEAEQHRRDLETNMSFGWVETISFRSRQDY